MSIGSSGLIVLIDDTELHRVLAKRILGSRSGIIYPESPLDVDALVPCDIGLVIVDRIMPKMWEASRNAFLDKMLKVNPSIEIIEWTAFNSLQPEDRLESAVVSVQKSDATELLPYVDRWLRTGHVLERQAVS